MRENERKRERETASLFSWVTCEVLARQQRRPNDAEILLSFSFFYFCFVLLPFLFLSIQLALFLSQSEEIITSRPFPSLAISIWPNSIEQHQQSYSSCNTCPNGPCWIQIQPVACFSSSFFSWPLSPTYLDVHRARVEPSLRAHSMRDKERKNRCHTRKSSTTNNHQANVGQYDVTLETRRDFSFFFFLPTKMTTRLPLSR